MKSKKTQRNSIKRRFSKKYCSLKSKGGNQAKESGLTSRELHTYLEDGLYFPVLINPRGTPNEKHTAFYKITSFRYGPNNIHLYSNLEQKVPEKLYESDIYDLVDKKLCAKYYSGEIKCDDHQKYAVKVVDMNVENQTIPRLLDVETISDEDKIKYKITDRSIKRYQDKLTKKIKVLVKTNTWTPIKF